MNKNNLNRIKGILSAKQGTLVPKFLKGNILYHKKTGEPIFRIDQSSNLWFTDENYQNLFNGNLNEYSENPVMTIQGGYNTNPNSSVINAAQINQQILQETQNFHNQTIARENVIKLPTISTVDVLNSMNEPFTPPTRNASPIETNLKLSKEDKLLSKQMHIEEKVANISPEREENWNKALNVMDGISLVGNAVGAALMATDSDTTKTATAVYDGLSNVISQAGPYGKIISGAMQAGKAIGDIAQWAGGGTDLQTKTDQWMDSPFFSWNVGLINGFAGKNTLSFGVDQETMEQVGSSYGGTATSINEAAESADKKYGLFSSKARKKADSAINKARQQQNLMGNIADLASDQRLAVQSMGEQAGLAYSIMTTGGYDLKYTYAAKEGGILECNPQIELKWEPQIELNWELPKFKEGGNVEFFEELNWVPTLQKGNKVRTIKELIEYAKKENPRFIQRLSEEPRGIKFIDDEGNEVEGSHYMESMGEYVVPRIQEINGELRFLSKEDAINRAIETGNYLKMNPEEAIIFAEQYKQGWPEFFKNFKKGGSLGNNDIPEIEETTQKNVIPEGALHKNKHHMEHAEGLTKKGIPVIDNDREQQAEIEHSEIIFTLEVTKKLEEYYQIFYSEESTNKEKEQAALDAGKLLVYQILENTEDRTGLIESCKQGGTLILKKSTDDLIEEALEWVPNITIIEEIIEEKPKKESKKSEKELIKEAIKELLIELLTK